VRVFRVGELGDGFQLHRVIDFLPANDGLIDLFHRPNCWSCFAFWSPGIFIGILLRFPVFLVDGTVGPATKTASSRPRLLDAHPPLARGSTGPKNDMSGAFAAQDHGLDLRVTDEVGKRLRRHRGL